MYARRLAIAAAALMVIGVGDAGRAAEPPPIWTAAYFGIQAGYGWGHSNIAVLDAPGVFVPDPFSMQGALPGVHLGYNRQFGKS